MKANTETTETTGGEIVNVYKTFRVSGRKIVLARGLTVSEAQKLVKSYPNSSRSMVFYTKYF